MSAASRARRNAASYFQGQGSAARPRRPFRCPKLRVAAHHRAGRAECPRGSMGTVYGRCQCQSVSCQNSARVCPSANQCQREDQKLCHSTLVCSCGGEDDAPDIVGPLTCVSPPLTRPFPIFVFGAEFGYLARDSWRKLVLLRLVNAPGVRPTPLVAQGCA